MRDPFDELPDVPLANARSVSARFLIAGVATFRDACAWVRHLPYGRNARPGPDAVFDEKRGTCQSKHGLIALLAEEIGVPMGQYAGAYRLDESIVDGIGPLLAAHGLTYVPQLHCVLMYGGRLIDLTAGNCHGKKKDIVEMDAYFRMSPFAPEAAYRAAYALGVRYYRQTDPRFRVHRVEKLRSIARACSGLVPTTCV
jgi:hypothetical protein